MQQQLAVAVRVVRLDRGLLVRRDVQADEPELAVARVRVGALQDGVALAQRLDLAAVQHEPGLDALEEVVVVPRAAVLGDQLLGRGCADCRSARFVTAALGHARSFAATLTAGGGWTEPHPWVGTRA